MIYTHWSVYDNDYKFVNGVKIPSDSRKRRFVIGPDADIKAKLMKNGKVRYFVSGRLMVQTDMPDPTFNKDNLIGPGNEPYIWKPYRDKRGNEIFEMEVKERDHVYRRKETKK